MKKNNLKKTIKNNINIILIFIGFILLAFAFGNYIAYEKANTKANIELKEYIDKNCPIQGGQNEEIFKIFKNTTSG